jgi:hypothetical protein
MGAEQSIGPSSNAGARIVDIYPKKEGRYDMDPLAHWMHQDNAVWRAIGWVIPIEAGVMAGAFARPGVPGVLVVLLGSFLVVAFWMYAWKSGKDRDVNLEIIDQYKPQGFRLSYEAAWYCKGSFWLKVEFAMIIVLNAFLFVLEFCKWRGCWTAATTMFFSK